MELTEEQRIEAATAYIDLTQSMDDTDDYTDEFDPTLDAFERYANPSWEEWSGREEGVTPNGHPYVHYEAAQAFKGQPRKEVFAIDFGTIRAVYSV